MRIFIFLLTLIFALPLQAGAAQKKSKRKPANNSPSRVMTFLCRESQESPESIIGMSNMSVDIRDSTVGTFGLSMFLRTEKGYTSKTLSGTYTTVPGGFILRTQWAGANGGYALLHIHPGDKTLLPGFSSKQSCEISGQMESL